MEKMINCSIKTLEDLFIGSHEWNTVIKYLNHVRVKEKQEDLDLSDFADPKAVLPIILQAGINIHYDNPSVEQLVSGQQVLSSYPRDLFVAPVEEDVAKRRSKRNGVLVVPTENPSLEQIKRPVLPIEIIEKTNNTWHDIFLCIKESPGIPINSLVIIDRYLFVRNGFWGWETGKNNIIKILSEALPLAFDERFDILIITSDESLDNQSDYDLDDMVAELNEDCHELRNYEINLEVLVLKNDKDKKGKGDKRLWDESHDRRIISNYYRIGATKGFFAFVGPRTNEVFRSQTITVDCAFSNLENKYAQLFGFPIKGYDATLSEIYRYVSTHQKSSPCYQFYKNGQWKKDLTSFENRIVMMQKS